MGDQLWHLKDVFEPYSSEFQREPEQHYNSEAPYFVTEEGYWPEVDWDEWEEDPEEDDWYWEDSGFGDQYDPDEDMFDDLAGDPELNPEFANLEIPSWFNPSPDEEEEAAPFQLEWYMQKMMGVESQRELHDIGDFEELTIPFTSVAETLAHEDGEIWSDLIMDVFTDDKLEAVIHCEPDFYQLTSCIRKVTLVENQAYSINCKPVYLNYLSCLAAEMYPETTLRALSLPEEHPEKLYLSKKLASDVVRTLVNSENDRRDERWRQLEEIRSACETASPIIGSDPNLEAMPRIESYEEGMLSPEMYDFIDPDDELPDEDENEQFWEEETEETDNPDQFAEYVNELFFEEFNMCLLTHHCPQEVVEYMECDKNNDMSTWCGPEARKLFLCLGNIAGFSQSRETAHYFGWWAQGGWKPFHDPTWDEYEMYPQILTKDEIDFNTMKELARRRKLLVENQTEEEKQAAEAYAKKTKILQQREEERSEAIRDTIRDKIRVSRDLRGTWVDSVWRFKMRHIGGTDRMFETRAVRKKTDLASDFDFPWDPSFHDELERYAGTLINTRQEEEAALTAARALERGDDQPPFAGFNFIPQNPSTGNESGWANRIDDIAREGAWVPTDGHIYDDYDEDDWKTEPVD